MAGAAVFLGRLRSHQKLGPPAVKTGVLAGSPRLRVYLPENVLNYTSAPVEIQKIVLDTLPQDTSFGQRDYLAPDGSRILVNVVLMGVDRTSIHKPQFCLEGAGWRIDQSASSETTVRVERPVPYDLPVMKLIASSQLQSEGQVINARAVYVYWFVAENAFTARHGQRMWWMARDLVRTGVLQRWAYITCFSVCLPGQEDATFQRIKEFIPAAVPEFQLTPAPVGAAASARSQRVGELATPASSEAGPR
jgi:hypothetical protein